MNIPLRCTCGILQGDVDAAMTYGRARCHCKDCQAYARFLGRPADILDAHGGTDIVAIQPAAVRLSGDVGPLSCMTLTEKGPLRWYTSCCRTPIANTPRDRQIPYVGLVSTCLHAAPEALDTAFGTAKIALNTASATDKVPATPAATIFGMLGIMGRMVGARVTGRHKLNPFFDATSGEPIRAPHGIDSRQRQAFYTP
jgi:hypothetical protein